MNIKENQMVQLRAFLWKIENGLIVLELNGQKNILNKSLTCIMKKLNETKSIKDIALEINEDYKESSYEDIYENVCIGIEILKNEGLVDILESDSDYDGWYDYD